jgi:hypothetical protein
VVHEIYLFWKHSSAEWICKQKLLWKYNYFLINVSQRKSAPYNLNFGTLISPSKYKEACKIQQYRPIYLLNVSFKIFTKVKTNRLMVVAHKVINPTQSAFLRNGGSSYSTWDYAWDEKKTQSGVVFKIDFEKMYNKIKWSFVKQTL